MRSSQVLLLFGLLGLASSAYRRRPQVAHIDCARLINGDPTYAASIAAKRPLLADPPPEDVDLNCEDIRRRFQPPLNRDVDFPIAFIKVVYQDYEFLEEQLKNTYASENVYCFAPDQKRSSLTFRRRLTALSAALPNVFLSSEEYDRDKYHHFYSNAQLDCLKLLLKKNKKWKYVLFQEDNDIVIKTHEEMAKIFGIMDGAADIEIGWCPDGRCGTNFERSLAKLGLCPPHLNPSDAAACRNANVTWAKGAPQVSLPRVTAEYLTEKMDLTVMLEHLNAKGWGNEDILLASLFATEELKIPGRFTTRCFPKLNRFLSAWSVWYDVKNCGSRYMSGSFCVFGVEDLPSLAKQESISAARIWPYFDYAAISCISEMLTNRTLGLRNDGFNEGYYITLEEIRYTKLLRDSKVPAEEIECAKLGPFKP